MTGPLPPALFVAAHPDDETLAMGVAIIEHINAGQDVCLVLLTRGEASSVRNSLNGAGTSTWWGVPHDPDAEGYPQLDPVSFGAARFAEATTAARCMATGLPGSIAVYEARLPDGDVSVTAAADAIRAVADLVAPGAPVRVKTHTHLVDDHPDHLNAGAAARMLAAADPARFGDLRHYILPAYWQDPRLAQISTRWDTPASPAIAARARNACRAYAAWHPPYAYAVGQHSVHAMLDQIAATPRCLVHN